MGVLRVSEVDFKNKKGDRIGICGLLQKFEVRPMRTGNQSLIIQLQDKDKEIEVRWFDVMGMDTSFLECGEAYVITVDIKEYDKGKDGISAIVYNNEVAKVEVDKRQFLNWEDNIEWATSEVYRMVNFVGDCDIGKLTRAILEENWSKIIGFPAASSMHHSGLGGLLVHTAGVCKLSEVMCDSYRDIYGEELINKRLLICGALLHDIGKLKELEVDPKSGKASYGLLGKVGTHIMHGISMITAYAIKMEIWETQEVYELIHLIGSHHGELEYGSPMQPSCIEADILHHADELDAMAYRRNKAYKELGHGDGSAEWKVGKLFVNYKATKEVYVPKI